MQPVEFLQEDNGSLSATRLALLLWIVGVLAAWIYVSISTATVANIPGGVITVMGILITGKVVQKFGEKPAEESSSTILPPAK